MQLTTRRVLGLFGLLLAAGVVALLAGVTSTRAAQPSAATRLYVQTAQSGTLAPVRGQRNRFVLTLQQPANRVIWFTDRPFRQVATEPLTNFVSSWGSRFHTSNPNAAIQVDHGGRHHDVFIVTLSKPVYNAGARTITYPVRRLTGKTTHALAGFVARGDHGLPRSFGRVAVFIDPSDESPIEVHIAVTSPTQDVAVMNFDNIQFQPGVTFNTTGPATVSGGYTTSNLSLGFGPIPAGQTSRISASFFVLPAVSTVSATIVALPSGATLTAQAGNGPTVSTTKPGRIRIPTS